MLRNRTILVPFKLRKVMAFNPLHKLTRTIPQSVAGQISIHTFERDTRCDFMYMFSH
jgi:hypothetical protein